MKPLEFEIQKQPSTVRAVRFHAASSRFKSLVEGRKLFVIQEDLDHRLTKERLERIASIKIPSRADADNWEWKETPANLVKSYSAGDFLIKDESQNPTGTIKARMAWEYVKWYAVWAKATLDSLARGETAGGAENAKIPRLSIITAGNAGAALAHYFEKYGLPRPHLLVSNKIGKAQLDLLKGMHCNIYMADLDLRMLKPKDILEFTNNAESGIDATSATILRRNEVYYDWFSYEVFNSAVENGARKIYLPGGSFETLGNLVFHLTNISARHWKGEKQDVRLKVDAKEALQLQLVAVTTNGRYISKLGAKFIFAVYDGNDFHAAALAGLPGGSIRIASIPNDWLEWGHRIVSGEAKINAEPAACAGMALVAYERNREILAPDEKVFVISTGKGIGGGCYAAKIRQ